jgi:hypothetical protein
MEMFGWLFDFAFTYQSAFPRQPYAPREGDAV